MPSLAAREGKPMLSLAAREGKPMPSLLARESMGLLSLTAREGMNFFLPGNILPFYLVNTVLAASKS